MGRLIIDGNSVYEIDEECMREKEQQRRKQQKNRTVEEILSKSPAKTEKFGR